MSIEAVLSLFAAVAAVVAALGIGGISGAFFQSRFEQQKQVREQEHELKRRRYGAILIIMLTKLDPATGLPHLKSIRPDLKNITDIEKEIEVELLNGLQVMMYKIAWPPLSENPIMMGMSRLQLQCVGICGKRYEGR